MKKLVYVFAMVGLFTFAAPIIANACTVRIIICDESYEFSACCYDDEDEQVWKEELCPDLMP